MIDAENNPSVSDGSETEEKLIERARGALSSCNWVIGECAARWTEKYARGRTDGDFGAQIGLSADQIFQRRRVWESFHDVREEYATLKWSHFYVAINWDDSAECLSWALENEATVAEMRAWRRSVHGEDLTTDADPLGLQLLDFAPASVREPGDFAGAGVSDVPFEATGSRSSSGEGEQTPYSPYRKDARGEYTGDDSQSEPVSSRSSGVAEAETPQRIVKRVVNNLRRSQQQLSELSEEDYNSLSPELINELWDMYDDLARVIKRRD
ncbi:MAG TPA: hypothetical protein DD473_01055 [Planctomycetaceae bacterium]|nr:hypothetical protein [Planctomycetaceae bacterium]